MKKINSYLLAIIIILLIFDIALSNINLNKISSNFSSMLANSINNNLYSSNKILSNYLNIKDNNDNYIFVNGMFARLYDEIVINKGSNDGIDKNYLVLSNNTLIGFISTVYKNSAIVKPINKYTLSVRVDNEYGILKEEDNELILYGFDNINIGDKVYTSGLTSVIGDIYVGEVSNKYRDDYILKRDIKYSDYRYLIVVGTSND